MSQRAVHERSTLVHTAVSSINSKYDSRHNSSTLLNQSNVKPQNSVRTPALHRFESEESCGPASQASQYSSMFNEDPAFWQEATSIEENMLWTSSPTTVVSTDSSGSLKRKGSESTVVSGSDGSQRPTKLQRVASLDSWSSSSASQPAQIKQVTDSSTSLSTFQPINLSPPPRLQSIIDRLQLPYSVRWELARMVSKGRRRWEDVEVPKLHSLKPAENCERKEAEGARQFAQEFLNHCVNELQESYFKDEKTAKDPWEELEKEDLFLKNHPGMDLIDGMWSGGRIHFLAILKPNTDTSDFRVELNQAEQGTSFNFSRKFGSKSFLRLKIPKWTSGKAENALMDFLRRPIVLDYSVFRAFCAKESTVFYFKTNERWNGIAVMPGLSESPAMSLLGFINWHNPLDYNSRQTMAKYAARIMLGLSSSIGGLTFQPEQITIIEDVVSEEGSEMTDGAGFITRFTLQRLKEIHGWDARPSAIQVRIMGSKGLLMEDPEEQGQVIGIKLRKSMVKIKYLIPDSSQLTLDLLRVAHARTPIRISTDVIINLYENGVPTQVFRGLLKKSLDAAIDPLLRWDTTDPKAMLALWDEFQRLGSVISARRAREEVAVARVRGYTERDVTEEVDDGDDDDTDGVMPQPQLSSSAWWPDVISGCPSSLEETVMCFLDSGFIPSECAVLRRKMHNIVKKVVSNIVKNFTIELDQSVSAWILPDPLGVLKPGELFFRSSHQSLKTQNGMETDIVTGDVLVTRDPCRLPSDVQKWIAVDVPELHKWKDIIILPITGSRRAADWLAGGDYDGDKAKVIWQPELVAPFKNADPDFASPPPNLHECFKTENEAVDQFRDRTQSCSEQEKLSQLQTYLLGGAMDQKYVGLYSKFCDNAIYSLGYKHPETKFLAYMFTTVLDGRKTGKSVLPEMFKEHWKKYEYPALEWRRSDDGSAKQGTSNRRPIKRGANLPPHIMDLLLTYGEKLKDEKLKSIEEKVAGYKHIPDVHLLQPYEEVRKRMEKMKTIGLHDAAKQLEIELEAIEKHVQAVYRKHREQLKYTAPNPDMQGAVSSGPYFTDLAIEKRQDRIREVSAAFQLSPLTDGFVMLSKADIANIKASYAYYFDCHESNSGFTHFPWDVAFRDLCAIKVKALGGWKPVAKLHYDFMTIKLPKRKS